MVSKISEFIQNIEKPVRLFFYFSLFDLLVGIVGTITYLIIATQSTESNNYYWFCTGLLVEVIIISILSLYLEVKRIKRERGGHFYLEMGFFGATCLISLLMAIFYGIGKKAQATFWCVYIFAVSLTNCFIVFLRTKRIENNSEDAENQNLNSHSPASNSKILSFLNVVFKLASFVVLILILILGSIKDANL